MRAVLKRQLGMRFGDVPLALLASIDIAGAVDIERWIDRVVDADNLTGVFSEP